MTTNKDASRLLKQLLTTSTIYLFIEFRGGFCTKSKDTTWIKVVKRSYLRVSILISLKAMGIKLKLRWNAKGCVKQSV